MFHRLFILLTIFAFPAVGQAPFWEVEWPNTDFSKTSVNFVDIISGGPPRDGIPALNEVDFLPVDGVDIPENEPVVTVEIDGQDPRAYPIRYLTWHEIANDMIGDVPVAVTFCPLCNSALVFDRRVNGRVLSFGVSGKLRNSDMIMFDRQSESWWQQFTGEAIVGDLLGAKLTQIVSWMEPMSEFRARNPDGLVMAEPTGYRRMYGANPYTGYERGQPFLYTGEDPPYGINALSRVIRVGNRVWPLERLQNVEELEEAGVRIVWKSGMAAALDTRRISDARDIGSIRVYDAVTGDDVLHEVVFAFAFHAFVPDGEWMLGNQ